MKKKDIRILLVDDEPDILEIISYNLKEEGYKVYTAGDGKEGIEIAKSKKPHLIILDVMMPVMDGIETCEEMRKVKALQETLIVFLTARSEDYSQMAGFDAGADDYINKPIKPRVLMSKVKSLLRRFKEQEKKVSGILRAGKLRVDTDGYKVTYEGKEVSVARKEFQLLSLLVSKPGAVFKRKDILEAVWGDEVIVGGRTIDVHIRKLREKLGEERFKTVKGVGYKYVK